MNTESVQVMRNYVEIELQKIDASTPALMDALQGAVLYGPDGKRLQLGKPTLVSSRQFRMSMRNETRD